MVPDYSDVLRDRATREGHRRADQGPGAEEPEDRGGLHQQHDGVSEGLRRKGHQGLAVAEGRRASARPPRQAGQRRGQTAHR